MPGVWTTIAIVLTVIGLPIFAGMIYGFYKRLTQQPHQQHQQQQEEGGR